MKGHIKIDGKAQRVKHEGIFIVGYTYSRIGHKNIIYPIRKENDKDRAFDLA